MIALPGVAPEHLSVMLEDDHLIVNGHRASACQLRVAYPTPGNSLWTIERVLICPPGVSKSAIVNCERLSINFHCGNIKAAMQIRI